MGKKSGGSPDYPDPSKTANQQAVLNEKTARTQASLNRINTYTPYGQSVYTDLGGDRWRNDIILSPDSEAAAKAEMLNSRLAQQLGTEQIGRIRSAISDPITMDSLLKSAGGTGDGRQGVEDALYGRATSRLDPEWETRARALETSLANKGISMGSEAWNRAMDQFSRGRNDAYAGARQDAVGAGGAEQSRLFGLGMSLRNQPINELSALLSSGQVSVPQFASPGQAGVAPVDYSSLVNAKYGAQANAAQQSQQNWMNGLFGLGSAAIGAWGAA